jgi:GH24 family phage-related lysozyme (muramidase)
MKKYPAYQAMTPNEKGAFLDFTYNITDGNGLSKYTDLNYYLKDKKYIPQIIQLMPAFRKGGGVIKEGLERRRADDMNLALQRDSKNYLPIFYKGGGY